MQLLKNGLLIVVLLISFESCLSKKKGTSRNVVKKSRKSTLHKAIETSAKASKKQDMNFEDINDGPVGKVVGGGMEGLGSDMHGFPTGMGAGAEPLGAFDGEEQPIMDNGAPQSVDDKSDSFAGEGMARPFGNFPSSMSDVRGSDMPPNGFASMPSGPEFQSQFGGLSNAEQDQESNAPPAAAVSMSNSLSNIDDKVNVQGDRDIGKIVLSSRAQEPSKELSENSLEQSNGEEQSEAREQEGEGQVEAKSNAEYVGYPMNDNDNNEEVAGKRRLVKHAQKRKNKFSGKPFKKLQHHH